MQDELLKLADRLGVDIKDVKKMEKKIKNLPEEIMIFENKDKFYHESWNDKIKGESMINFPLPFKCIIFGKTNSGKTLLCQNILAKQFTPFEKIYLCHCGDDTREWDDIDVERLDEIPPPNFFDVNKKEAIIFEDLAFDSLDKEQKSNLDRIYGYSSTHLNVVPFICVQRNYNIPLRVRAGCNVWILYNLDNIRTKKMLGNQLGFESDEFIRLMDMLKGPHDSLCIDRTKNTKYPLRKNLYEIIS